MARRFTSTFTCEECGFTTRDYDLIKNHSCEVQEHGGHCEDYPCCGHEWGDCNGLKYGSDESIKAAVHAKLDDPNYDPYYDEDDR